MRRIELLRHAETRDLVYLRVFDDEGAAPEVEIAVDFPTWKRKDFTAINREADEALAGRGLLHWLQGHD